MWCPLPFKVWVRRRATLPHPSRCSTIAVPGLSFRVRNGSGRLPWAMAAANLQLSSHGFPWGSVWWVGDRIVDATEGLIHVTCRVSPCRPSDAFVCSCHPVWVIVCVAVRLLVPVGSTPRGASTSGLSTTCSPWSLQTPRKGSRNPDLGAGFPLRCFQRLSLPNVANRPRHWRDDRHTRGSSTQVLSYYGQASSGFQRAQRIETKLSHDVLNPARVPL